MIGRLRWFLSRRTRERDMRREVQAAIDAEADELVGSGMGQEDAQAAAKRNFGNDTQLREDLRTFWSFPLIEEFIRDVFYFGRQVQRSPGFAIATVGTLAVAIGVCTAVFSVADPLLLRGLPVDEPSRLVQLRQPDSQSVPYAFFERLLQTSVALSGASMLSGVTEGDLIVGDRTERVRMESVSGGHFQTLGLPASAGRMIDNADDIPGAPPAAVISDSLWRDLFDRDDGVVGTQVRVNDDSYVVDVTFTVVGVAPRGFRGVQIDHSVDMWIPFHNVMALAPESQRMVRAAPNADVLMIARLADGSRIDDLQAESDYVVGQLREQLRPPVTFQETVGSLRSVSDVMVEPLTRGYSDLREEFMEPLTALAVVVSLVLVIATINVGALAVTRGIDRTKELAVRQAIGGGGIRVVRQLLTEGLLLSAAGGLLGLAVARTCRDVLTSYLPANSDFPSSVAVDTRVVLFCISLTGVGLAAAGLFPAWRATRGDLLPLLNDVGRKEGVGANGRPLEFARLIITAQVTFSLVMIVAAGLFIGTLTNLRNVRPGFDQDLVVQFRVENHDPNANPFSETREEILAVVTAFPEVQSAAIYNWFGLLGGRNPTDSIRRPDQSESDILAADRMLVGPGFFETFGIPIVAGRASFSDAAEPETAIVSESLARRLFGQANPVGRVIMQGGNRLQIVGVVEDARHGSLRDAPRPAIYRVYQGGGPSNARFAARARTPAGAELLKSRIQSFARQFGQGFSATDIYTMREVTELTLARERFLAQLVGGLGLLSIMLTAGGIYGLVAHSMRRRRPEFAIRLAVGAEFRHLTVMAVGESTLPVVVGCLLGLVVSHVALRTISSLLYGMGPADPWISAFATALVVIVAVLAAYFPVSRAARMDPLATLRAQ